MRNDSRRGGRPVPPTGPTTVTDNVPAGQKLLIPGPLIWLFFEQELKEHFLRTGGDATTETGTTQPE